MALLANVELLLRGKTCGIYNCGNLVWVRGSVRTQSPLNVKLSGAMASLATDAEFVGRIIALAGQGILIQVRVVA
jgi:hypothetical protein